MSMSSPGGPIGTLDPTLPIAREGGAWNFVPEGATQELQQNIFGVAGNGAPLGTLFDSFGTEAGFNAKVIMTNAMATGTNPKAIASALADTLDVSQARAQTIARTELLGAYRDAQIANYRANMNDLQGWMWSASGGCCAACMFMDGSVHGLDEGMDSRSEERRVGKECRSRCDWSSDVCSSDLLIRSTFRRLERRPSHAQNSSARIGMRRSPITART